MNVLINELFAEINYTPLSLIQFKLKMGVLN